MKKLVKAIMIVMLVAVALTMDVRSVKAAGFDEIANESNHVVEIVKISWDGDSYGEIDGGWYCVGTDMGSCQSALIWTDAFDYRVLDKEVKIPNYSDNEELWIFNDLAVWKARRYEDNKIGCEAKYFGGEDRTCGFVGKDGVAVLLAHENG